MKKVAVLAIIEMGACHAVGLSAENKKRYPEYKQAREKIIELLTAKNNVERFLGMTGKKKNRGRQREAR
ncbi:MAG: hypothetical protein HFF98_04460 [Oscillibacter sp.]|nr:hypothetical protein [Oscillibacter sp.]